MADFNGDTTTPESELNDDIIIEIVKRLPLKCAKQCSVLNKNICRSISHHPDFLPSCKIFFHYFFRFFWQEIIRSPSAITQNTHPVGRSVTLPMRVSIMASCNGMILLRFDEEPYLNLHHVFNPTTSAITKGVYLRNAAVGLAVPENSPFKLVVITAYPRSGGTRLVFRVIAPKCKSPVKFDCGRSFKLMMGEGSRPVYAHGSLYWLGERCRAMVAFDVEKEEARLIDGPVKDGPVEGIETRNGCRTWFGFADGEVHFAYSSPSETVICRHDHVSDEWRVRSKHRTSDVCDDGVPLFFDGLMLLFLAMKSGEAGGHVYWYDVVRDLWSSASQRRWRYWGYNFSYTPTFMEVYDRYLNEKNTTLWKDEERRNVLLELQKMLSPIYVEN